MSRIAGCGRNNFPKARPCRSWGFSTCSPHKAVSWHHYIQAGPYENKPIWLHKFLTLPGYRHCSPNPSDEKFQKHHWKHKPHHAEETTGARRRVMVSRGTEPSTEQCFSSVTVGAGGRSAGCGPCLSCCWCGCRFCTVRGTSWVGSQICQALWDSRWWCRRLSAGAVLGRSWIFHLAAGCSCSVSETTQQWSLS